MAEMLDSNRVLDALGDPSRRQILLLLRNNPLPVGQIASQLPISRPAVSKHLRILEEAGLVGYHEEGTRNIFYLQSSGFQSVRFFLELFWDEALSNFKQFSKESDSLNGEKSN